MMSINNLIRKGTKILLVIAHPDDEAMFFGPFLVSAKMQQCQVHILCLSDGNYDGLGHIREKELIDSANVFGIPRDQVHLIRHDLLPDGMENDWPISVISLIIEYQISKSNTSLVISFDSYGVSGHPNHIAVYNGVVQAISSLRGRQENISGYALESVNIFRKFSGFFDIFWTKFFSDSVVWTVMIKYVLLGMMAHKSQFVWYRKLFVAFSRYTYVNSFKKL